MKRWLAYLLIALFSIQALPVRELCKNLLKKSVVAQSADDSDEDEGLNKEDDAKAKAEPVQKFLAAAAPFSCAQRFFEAVVGNQLHRHSRLPAAHHFEVPTPPPDSFA